MTDDTAARSIDDDRTAVATETARLLETAHSLDPGSIGAPSLCDGWTRGHVLAHIARNADALVNLVTAATTGERIPMYSSPEARDDDINAGAPRPLDEHLADLGSSAARWARAAARLTDDLADVRVEARGGTMVRAGYLPFMRLREVVFHHVDLDAGYGFGDVDPDLVKAFLDDTVHRLFRNPETPGMTIRTTEQDAWSLGDGRPTVSGSRAGVLAWLARGASEGVVGDLPTLPFGG